MNKKLEITIVLFALIATCFTASAQNERMKWWDEARFGMFIHWGVYAVYGNLYEGPNITGETIRYDRRGTGMPSEWIMYEAKIPRSIYREAANQFDAKDYNPKEWVRIAKETGMKYIVITSKHHDGFCLFETGYTDWNSTDASAAKRDLLKDLVREAKAAGLKMGFYYSQNLDWMADGGMGKVPELNGGEYSPEKVKAYVENLVIPQLTELTTNYDVDLIWFDIPKATNATMELSQKILKTILDSPIGNKVIYNDRLYKDIEGNFETPETDTPGVPYNGYDDGTRWESCSSVHTTSWGFEYQGTNYWQSDKHRIKTGLYCVSRILELSSKGGNLLLNVGPDRHGNIPDLTLNTLKDIGSWMSLFGDAVYATEKNNLLNPFEFGYVTRKVETDGSEHWYLHVSTEYWNEQYIYLNGIKTQPLSCTVFNSSQALETSLDDNRLSIFLPQSGIHPYYITIDLHFPMQPEQIYASSLVEGEIRLTPFQAKTDSYPKKDYIPYALKDWHSGEIEFDAYLDAGTYNLGVEYAAWCADGEFTIDIEGTKYTVPYRNTGDCNINYDIHNYVFDDSLTTITILKSKMYKIKMKRIIIPDVTNWIHIRQFVLKRTGVGIPEANGGVLIYPNPTTGVLICESTTPREFKLYDLHGRLLKSFHNEHSNEFNIRELGGGIYIIKTENYQQKIILL